MSEPADSTGTVTLTRYGAPPSGRPRSLLVFEEGSAVLFGLPPGGEVIIGRAAEADLRLKDQAASRRHARLLIEPDRVQLQDLGSHNGTLVNGVRTASCELCGGDVITICDVTLVFQGDVRRTLARPIRTEGALRERLEEEIERSLRYQHPLTLVCIALGTDGGASPAERGGRGPMEPLQIDKGLLGALLGEGRDLGVIDVVAFSGPAHLLLLLPEREEDEATEAAGRLVQALLPAAREARAGYACCPQDGCDVETLISGARAAADRAGRGQVLSAGAVDATRRVGDRSIVVADPAMVRLYGLVERLAKSDLPVLIHGATGTGKEVVARALHHWSRRADGPVVSVNCAALPDSLAESELFGHEKGAFTGAVSTKPGLLESASGGTVFLDEVSELSPAVQAKLLRVLESRRAVRLGDVREREVDIRVVAATNRDLEVEVARGRFRQDLYYRLSAATVALPALCDRRRELPLLARAFLAEACARAGRPAMTISAPVMARLLAHGWPGNLRELRNLMDYAAATVVDGVLEPWHLPPRLAGPAEGETAEAEAEAGAAGPGPDAAAEGAPKFRPIEEEVAELERRRMLEALAATGGHHRRAAELIGMAVRTFATKFKRYGLSDPPGGPA